MYYYYICTKPTFGLKLTILFSLTMMHGFPSLKPKLVSLSPEQLPSKDLLKRQAFLCPTSLSTLPRSVYDLGTTAGGTKRTH